MVRCKEALKAEESCTLWSPISNYAVDVLDVHDCGGGAACSSFTKELICKYIEREEKAGYNRARAWIDQWLAGLAVALELSEEHSNDFCTLKSGGPNLFTDHNSAPQIGHIDFETTRQSNMDFLLAPPGVKAWSLWICLGSQSSFLSTEKDNKELSAV